MIKELYLEDEYFSIKGKQYSKNQLKEWYLIENKSTRELQDLLGLSRSSVGRLLKFYNLKKDKQSASEIAKCTMLKKYGTESYTQTEEYRVKYKQTCLNKYGVESHNQADSVKEKYKNTCMERYGVETTAIIPEVASQRELTCLLKYGVSNPAQSLAVQDKIKNTNIERYGVSSYTQTEEFHKKVVNACLVKFGETSYSKTKEHRENMSRLSKERSEQNWSEECRAVLRDRNSLLNYLVSLDKKPTALELSNKLNCSISTIGERVRQWKLYDYFNLSYSTSSYEKEIKAFLKELGVVVSKNRIQLDGLEIDLYNEEKKIGIEFNGTYWHSLSVLGDKNYHLKKSKLAESKGIRLIHIYEYEWNDPNKKPLIESLIKIAFGKVNEKIYARKCEIREVSNKEAKDFNNKNHLQGHRNAQVTYGLYYQGQLRQLMSFSKTKYNKNLKGDNEWEIIRGCPGSNNIVVGGVSRLFKHFIEQNNPDKVFSYCDFNKFDGKGYEAIGMCFVGYTGPDMKWVLKDRSVVSRQPSKHVELKKQSVDQIFGAGSKKYIWEKK
jgi:hypothetical protein